MNCLDNFKTIIISICLCILCLNTTVFANLSDGLIAHFTFDETLNCEINSYEVIAINPDTGNPIESDSIAYTEGVNDQAIVFNTTKKYIQATAVEDKQYTTFTVSFWAKIKYSEQCGMVIGFTNSKNEDKGYIHFYQNNFYVNFDGDSQYYTANKLVCPDEWRLYTVAYNGTNIYLFVNGKKTYWSGIRNYKLSNSFLFGKGQGKSYPYSTYNYQGLLDDVRIYERFFSDSEILDMYVNLNIQYQQGYEAGMQKCIVDPSSCGISSNGIYTELDMQNMVNKLLEWDTNKDMKIGLHEAVKSLRDLTGVK